MKIKTECALCPQKIWEYNGIKFRKTEEYNETEVKLNDLSTMVVGVCSAHIKLKKSDYPLVTEKMHQGWLEELAFGIGHDEWIKTKGMQLEVVGG